MADGATDSSTETEDTTTEPTEEAKPETDLAAEVEKWKALSRKNEEQAKANAEAAKRLAEIEDANKTEAEKQAEALRRAEQDRDEALTALAKAQAAVKHGLNEEDLELLGHGTPEEIEQRAELLAKRISERDGRKPDRTLGQQNASVTNPDEWLRNAARR